MIDQILTHVLDELNDYLFLRSQVADRAVMGHLYDKDKLDPKTQDKIVMLLVNVTEERTYRSTDFLEKRPDGKAERVVPPVKVNLHILFIANLGDYSEAMKAVGQLMSFFQHRPFFDLPALSELADNGGRLNFELESMTFEQINHLWGALGAKYMPSVLYKAGILDVRDRQLQAEVAPVEEIAINA